MRTLIQRVARAQASETLAPENDIAAIQKGMVILVGFEEGDSQVCIEQMAQKIRNLRIFADPQGKMNLSGPEVEAQYLITSQFTLYADCKYGNRPSFAGAAPKLRAKEYYEHFVATMSRIMGEDRVTFTPFGSDLHVGLINDGPVTIWLDSKEIL